MTSEKSASVPPSPVEHWLEAIGIESLCQWDVVVFLYRHQASLANGEHIARLLGYPIRAVVAALNSLELLGLLQRSRVSQGVRLYQFAVPPDPRRGKAFDELLALANGRAGRLLLLKTLRRPRMRSNQGSSYISKARGKGGDPCLKAI